MISIRSILLILLVWLLLWLAQRWYKKNQQKQTQSKTRLQPERKTEHKMMVRCDHCGLYFPEQEALHSGKARYCCEAHKRAEQQPR